MREKRASRGRRRRRVKFHQLLSSTAPARTTTMHYVRGSGLSIDLVNAVAQSNHIAAGGFGGRALRVLSDSHVASLAASSSVPRFSNGIELIAPPGASPNSLQRN